MQSPGDVIAEQGEGAVAEQGSTAGVQLWAADRLGSRAGGCSFPRPGASVRGREESREGGERAEPGAAAAAAGLWRPSPASQPERSEGEARSGRGGWTSGR